MRSITKKAYETNEIISHFMHNSYFGLHCLSCVITGAETVPHKLAVKFLNTNLFV